MKRAVCAAVVGGLATYFALVPVAVALLPQGLVWKEPPAPHATATMRASVYLTSGDESVMDVRPFPRPVPNAHQVLVQVLFAGANPVDFKFRRDSLWPIVPRPKISGFDFSGTVVQAPPGSAFKPGDRVHGMLPCPFHSWGTYAELVAADEAFTAHVPPRGMTMQEAAGAPLAALTAWQAIERAKPLPAGAKVLVHAGAGGVGNFLVQLAKANGWHVTTTCSAGAALCKALGADVVVDYKREDFERVVPAGSLDAVFDCIGGAYLQKSMRLCKLSGTYVEILNDGLLDYLQVSSVTHPLYQAYFVGQFLYYTLRGALGLGPAFKRGVVQANGEQLAAVDALVAKGEVRVVVDRVFDGLGQGARDAHAYLATNKAQGKVLVDVTR